MLVIEGKLAAEFSVNGDKKSSKIGPGDPNPSQKGTSGITRLRRAFDAELETKCRERVAAEAQRLLDARGINRRTEDRTGGVRRLLG